MRTEEIMARLQAKYPTEKEYLQAVREVLECIEDVYNKHRAPRGAGQNVYIPCYLG